ncbi:lytic polysaccharide monooxygenase [Xylaria bambusicola]|uniref:lytic polysaccharide monooxygenase n=1 Tax=Xylaria bambusicola TaxID=326684 RepID=UPI002008D27F|nr:lytic polysaccharide monooxygenase [Xylaria bambusicola]KAI0503235.1 lytic polysaccharide monooxygenase [Xylaria bambusicola]
MRSMGILTIVLAAARVESHGGIYNYKIDGIDYAGHYPWLPEEGQVSIQRRWWPDPILTTQHPNLACNRGNPAAKTLPKLHAPVRAGANVTACPPYGDYDPPMKCQGPEYYWPHGQGPVMVYMANCEGPCDEWDGTGKRWFKVWETGYSRTSWPEWQPRPIPGDTPISTCDAWEAGYYIVRRGVNMTIPKPLKPGNYLIRHEVINLEANLQIYPECAQLNLTSEGDAVPSPEYLVEFPGAYRDITEPRKLNFRYIARTKEHYI